MQPQSWRAQAITGAYRIPRYVMSWPWIARANWRWCAVICALAVLCLTVPDAMGQTVEVTQWASGSVDLSSSQWREHEGDDLAWAQTGFDDSGWHSVELDELGAAQPGWRWYRLHVKLAANRPHEHLLIAGGEGVYELYVNGQRDTDTQLCSMFQVKRPTEQVMVLPDDVDEFTLALRTRATPSYTIWHLPLFLTVSLGTSGAIDDERASLESQRLYAALPSLAVNGLLVLAGLAVFALYMSQRGRSEYLWLGLYLFLLGLSNGLLYASSSGVGAAGMEQRAE